MKKRLFALASLLLLAACAAAPADNPGETASDTQADAFSTYLSARFAANQYDLPAAARYYAQSAKENPGNATILSRAYFYAGASGDIEAAGKFARQIVATNPIDPSARLTLAVIAFKHRDYAGARKDLQLSTKGPFQSLVISMFDAWAAAAEGDVNGAMADMKALSAQTGAEGLAAFHTALIDDYLGDADTGSAYERALAANRASPRVVEAYGIYLERAGRKDAAKALYLKYRQDPGAGPVAEAGLARIAAGRKPQAFVPNAADGVAEGLFGMAASLNDQSSVEISILYLRMALYLRPDLALADLLLADRFETLEKFQDAVAIYRDIGKASPYYRMAATQAAMDESRIGRKKEALDDLKALTEAFPDVSENWIALGDAYRDQNDLEAAIAAYNQAEKALGTPQKRDWTLFYARAMAEDKANQWNKAEADVERALKLSPDQPELLNYLGYSWVDRNEKVPEALAMLEKASQLRPYDGYIKDSVGWAYYRLGRYDEAASTLEAAVLLVPGDPTINEHLGDALWKDGRKMDARFQWSHALAFSGEGGDKAELEEKLKNGLTG